MGETKTPHFHDLWVFEAVISPQNQTMCIFGDTRTPKNKIRKCGNIFEHIIFANLTNWEIGNFEFLDQIWKRRAPNNDEDPSKQISEILDMGSISS